MTVSDESALRRGMRVIPYSWPLANASGRILAVVWGLATVWTGLRLLLHAGGRYAGWPLHIVLTGVLLWHLTRAGSTTDATSGGWPESGRFDLDRVGPDPAHDDRTRGSWSLLAVLAVAVLVMPTITCLLLRRAIASTLGIEFLQDHARFLSPWIVLQVGLAAAAAGIVIARRDGLSGRMVRLGLAVGAGAAVGQLFRVIRTGSGSDVLWIVLNLICVPILFVAGGMLLEHTRVGRARLWEGRAAGSIRSFVSGAAVCVPFGLLNATYGAHSGRPWASHWWDLAGYAWSPALGEETWARLFLIGFCCALLLPVAGRRPGRAIVAAALLSALGHGLVHARTLALFAPQAAYALRWTSVTVFETGLLFLLPMAALFIKRDWEHAVGFHYAVNLIPMVVAFR
jgi:hypothetical protein